MTLTQMRYFATTCELQNISLAAQMLYISQPALSATLADLEKEVGFKLFNRKSKGVIPTEEGLLLLQHINSVLKRANLLQQEIPLISRHQQVIRVGFRPYSGETVFFRLFKQYQSECGTDGLILKVNEMSNITPYVFLDENQIDFLFGSTRSMPAGWESKYEYTQVGAEKLQLFAHESSPIFQREVVHMEDLQTYPSVFWQGHQVLLDHITREMAQKGLQMNCISILPQISGLIQFVYHNIAIGFLGAGYVEGIPSIREVPLGEDVIKLFGEEIIPIMAYWKKNIENYETKKKFIDYLKTISC